MCCSNRVHRVPDYTGASKEERVERMQQIVQIAVMRHLVEIHMLATM